MNLKERAARDFRKHITKDRGVGTEISISSPSNDYSATVKGICMLRGESYDVDGRIVDTDFGWITISEKDLIDEGYPTRDNKGNVSLSNHKISFIGDTGNTIMGMIQSIAPDDVFGMIRCIIIG